MNETNESELLNEPVAGNPNRVLSSSTKPKRFPGVSSFEDDELAGELFYGREEESQKLLHYVLSENLVVVFSYSGYGKTSLLKARVFRKLREKNFCPILVRFNKKESTPQQLIQLETESLATGKNLEIIHHQADDGTPSPNSLIRYFKSLEIWSQDDKLITPVIVLDQFEEMFTLAHNQGYASLFFEDLAGLLKECKEGTLDCKVIISIREDFLGHLEVMAVNVPSVFTNRFRLEALQKKAAREAIVEPAQKQLTEVEFASPPFSFSEESINEILEFLSLKMMEGAWKESAYIEPVQLQIICSELENKIIRKEIAAGEDGQIIIQPKHYGKTEGLRKIAANFYDQQITAMQRSLSLSAKETDAVKEVIETGLIAGTRRVPLAYDAVVSRPTVSKSAIDMLIANKLLKLESHRGNSLLELSHDTLVAPVLASAERRTTEKDKQRKRALFFRYAGLSIVLVGLLSYFIYNNRSTKRAKQDKYYYTALMAGRQNPTLGYKIAMDGAAIGSTTPELKTLISQFRSSNNIFTTNKFYFRQPVTEAYFAGDKKSLTILGGQAQRERWSVKEGRRLSADSTKDWLATCRINGEYLSVKSRHDSIVVVGNQGQGLASINAEGFSKGMRKNVDTYKEQVRLVMKSFATLLKNVPATAGTSATLNFIYDRRTFTHFKDSSLYFFGTLCCLYNAKNDSVYFFNKDNIQFESTYSSGTKNNTNNVYGKTGEDPFGVAALAVTSDFQHLVYSADNRVRILDMATLRAKERTPKELDVSAGAVSYIAVSPDDSLILTSDKTTVARLWNLKGEAVAILQGHQANITYANFSADGKEVITADESGQVFVWKLASNVTPNELVHFSPFDYHALGLYEAQYTVGKLYDTTSFSSLLAAAQHYEASLPLSNPYPGNLNYAVTLAAAFLEVQGLYESVFRSRSFATLSNGDKNSLANSYTALLLKSLDYQQYNPALAGSVAQRLTALYHGFSSTFLEAKNYLDDSYETTDAVLQALQTSFLDRKKYDTANQLSSAEIALQKSVLAKNGQGFMGLEASVSANYNNLSYYLLFEHKYKEAVAAADSSMFYAPTYNIPNTNKALGYLLNGQFENAKEIYLKYKSSLKTDFLNDFDSLAKEGIISPKEPRTIENMNRIKALLGAPDTVPAGNKK